ncbi:MAG: hypothetical protein WCJ30_06930, partial [Deltaproteobacteria bacterium]
VVTARNYDRLTEVLDHLAKHFVATPYAVTIKRVELGNRCDLDQYLQESHVPLAPLRRALGGLIANSRVSAPVVFRGFPLCAVPGGEHLHADVTDWDSEVKGFHNFEAQGRVSTRDVFEQPRTVHDFDWLCESCTLSPLCRDRGLFLYRTFTLDDVPSPTLGPAPVRIADVLARARGAVAGASTRAPGPLATLLRDLSRESPSGTALPGTTITWQPHTTGALLLLPASASPQVERSEPLAEHPRSVLVPALVRALAALGLVQPGAGGEPASPTWHVALLAPDGSPLEVDANAGPEARPRPPGLLLRAAAMDKHTAPPTKLVIRILPDSHFVRGVRFEVTAPSGAQQPAAVLTRMRELIEKAG